MADSSYSSDLLFLHKQWDKNIFKYQLEVGSIILMPKPPGGVQLESYIDFLSHREINVLVSLLQYDEINAHALINENTHSETNSIEYINFQIQDHSVPQFFIPFNQLVENLTNHIKSGGNIAIHCYAGIGRTGILAASILIKLGMQVDDALINLSKVRGLRVPETLEQISWLHHHADELVKTRLS